jgi:VCBS repeat-containing protein
MAIVAGFTADPDILVAGTSAVGFNLPFLTALADGRFLATWTTGGSTLNGQILSAAGAKLGSSFVIGSSQAGASVAALPDGGFAIVWAASGGSAPVTVRFYGANGVAVGADIVVSTSANHHDLPQIVRLASGGFAVAWQESDPQNSLDVRGRLLDSTGHPTGSEFAIPTVVAGSQYHVELTALASGGFAAAWMDNGVFGSVAGQEVKARVFDSAGLPVGAEFVAPAANAGDQGQPVIGTLPSGGFVMAWWTANPTNGDGSGYAVKAQLFDAAGTRVGNEILANSSTAGDQYLPSLTVLSNGDFVIAWTDFSGGNGDSSGYAVRAQLFDTTGARLGAEFIIPQATVNNQRSPVLAAGPGGSFAALWQDTVIGGDSSNGPLKMRLFAPIAAANDAVSTTESTVLTGNLFADHGSGADGAGSVIAQVNGSAAAVGSTIVLASGAHLTVNADGTYSYDPNHAFDALPDAASGAVNSAKAETFTYTLTGGATATATVTVNGIASVGDRLEGDSSDNVFYVDDLQDTVVESPGGGVDEVRTALGSRTDSTQHYHIPDNVENLTGTSTGDQGVWGNGLDNVIVMGGGNDMIVLADPVDLFAPGQGADQVHGGGGDDYMFFGGSFTNADSADGGAGYDTVTLLGNFSLAFDDDDLVSVEKLVVFSSGDPAAPNGYNLTMADANVAPGAGLMVVAQSLQPGEHLVFDGSAETSGRFNVRGGHDSDTMTTGAGNDQLWGSHGADILSGGGGQDSFEYYSVSESTPESRDTILDFATGDHINLINIDADGDASNGNSVFRFIGDQAFTGAAGEIRVYEAADHPGMWIVEGDVDGDGAADLSIAVVTQSGSTLVPTDFWL